MATVPSDEEGQESSIEVVDGGGEGVVGRGLGGEAFFEVVEEVHQLYIQ